MEKKKWFPKIEDSSMLEWILTFHRIFLFTVLLFLVILVFWLQSQYEFVEVLWNLLF